MYLTLQPNLSTLIIYNNILGVCVDRCKELVSYVAGLMDGDGSFSIIKNVTSCNPNYYPLMQFTNWRKGVVEVLKEAFGGHIVATKPSVKKDGSLGHVIYRWKLRGCNNVTPALKELIPFLRIKKDRATFLLDFANKFEFIRGKKLEGDVLRSRESDFLKMVNYNCWRSASNNLTTKVSKNNSNDSVFWSYVAGMMDTDGSFSVKKQIRNQGTHIINPRYLPVILVSSIDTRALNYIRENCSVGKVYCPKNKATSTGFHYQFGIYSKKDCALFLNKILPHLVGKKDNARVLLDFCENAQNAKYCKAGISTEELEFRDRCYQRLVELNKYGVSKSPLMDLELLPGNAGDNKAQAAKACSVNVASEETSE